MAQGSAAQRPNQTQQQVAILTALPLVSETNCSDYLSPTSILYSSFPPKTNKKIMKTHADPTTAAADTTTTVAHQATGKKSRREGYKHALYKLWHLAYLDKSTFGQPTLQLSQADVQEICKRSKRQPEQQVYVIPAQPSRPLSPTNAVLVNKPQRKFLLALWKLKKDEAAYRRCVDVWINT